MPRDGYERFDGSAGGSRRQGDRVTVVDDDVEAIPHTSFITPSQTQRNDAHAVEGFVVSDARSRWENVKDLDHFFTNLYNYQQRGGFGAIVVGDVLQLVQFVFIVVFGAFLVSCVDYGILFNDKPVEGHNLTQKRHFADVVRPHCVSQLPFLLVVGLLMAFVFLVIRIMRVVYQTAQHWDMRLCYLRVLDITPEMLDNLTWHQVLRRLIEAQREVQLCIHKRDLTELDVYQRILRHKNYMVAMVNKGLLPTRYEMPFTGHALYFTEMFKANVHWLLFTGPFSPWKDYFTLKSDFKDDSQLERLTEEMQKVILYLGLANLCLMPLIFVYQILYSFCQYAQLMKRQPGALGMRRWSNYSRYALRHFNELPHELHDRLCRAHRAATQYMDQFTTHLSEAIAQNMAVMAGFVFAVIAVLSVWDEDVLQVCQPSIVA